MYNKYNVLFPCYGKKQKITKISFKNKISIETDPNTQLNLKYYEEQDIDKEHPIFINWKNVKQLCDSYDVPFINQSVCSFV